MPYGSESHQDTSAVTSAPPYGETPKPRLGLHVPMGNAEVLQPRRVPGADLIETDVAGTPDYGDTYESPSSAAGGVATPAYGEPMRAEPYGHGRAAYEDKPMLAAAAFGGAVGALIGAILWALITVATDFQIGWMAWGVGILAGMGIRVTGGGPNDLYGWLGASMALGGCLFGNVLAGCAIFSKEFGIPFFEVLFDVGLSSPGEILEVMFHPLDLLFYGLAIFTGWRLSRGEGV